MIVRRPVHFPELDAERTDQIVDLLAELAHILMDLRPNDEDRSWGTIEELEDMLEESAGKR